MRDEANVRRNGEAAPTRQVESLEEVQSDNPTQWSENIPEECRFVACATRFGARFGSDPLATSVSHSATAPSFAAESSSVRPAAVAAGRNWTPAIHLRTLHIGALSGGRPAAAYLPHGEEHSRSALVMAAGLG